MATKKTASKKTNKAAATKKKAASSAAKKPAAAKPVEPVKAASKAKPKVKAKLTAKEKKEYRMMLLTMRDRLTGQIAKLQDESLHRHDSVNSEDDGTDAYDRQFALSLAATEQDSVVAIDDALVRLEDGSYGVCDECNCLIETPRLQALPFVRMCIKCKSELERNRQGFRRGPAFRR